MKVLSGMIQNLIVQSEGKKENDVSGYFETYENKTVTSGGKGFRRREVMQQ